MEALVESESGVSVVLEIEIRNGEATLKDIDMKIRGKSRRNRTAVGS
jgi:hypothetical protein